MPEIDDEAPEVREALADVKVAVSALGEALVALVAAARDAIDALGNFEALARDSDAEATPASEPSA